MAQPMTSSTAELADLRSRSAARRELVWSVNPSHPIIAADAASTGVSAASSISSQATDYR
jgi:trehalose utilization protein